MKKYHSFSFFKVDPKWRWMSDLAKEESAKEVKNILTNSNIIYNTYSTLGLHADAEFLLHIITNSLENIQTSISKLYFTVFGKYILPTTIHTSTIINEQQHSKNITEQQKYITVYTLIKKTNWYKLEKVKKNEIRKICLETIKKYNNLIFDYSISTGLSKYDIILIFKSNNILELQSIINKLNYNIIDYMDMNSTTAIKEEIQKLIMNLG